jgi:hypothetical protein
MGSSLEFFESSKFTGIGISLNKFWVSPDKIGMWLAKGFDHWKSPQLGIRLPHDPWALLLGALVWWPISWWGRINSLDYPTRRWFQSKFILKSLPGRWFSVCPFHIPRVKPDLWLCHVATICQGGDDKSFLTAQVLIGIHEVHVLGVWWRFTKWRTYPFMVILGLVYWV